MKVPFRYILPAAMGTISAMLIVWDIHNQRVIMSMGMGWDTGAPLWPYQTPDTLLFALNAPAYIIARAISGLLDLGMMPKYYLALYPAILLWWWLAGLYFDNHLVIERSTKTKKVLLCLLAFGLICLGVEQSRWAFQWWWTYSRTLFSVTDVILLRSLAPSIWCFVIGFILLLTAWRYRRNATTPST